MHLMHNVFFTLKKNSQADIQKLVDACRKYLTIQAGIKSFACGTRDLTLTRDVNVVDWDVGLHILFESRADHDAYQSDHFHEQFVAENKDNWSNVKVFDSLV